MRLELRLSRTYFHGSKGVRAIEVPLNIKVDIDLKMERNDFSSIDLGYNSYGKEFFPVKLQALVSPGRVAQSVGHLTRKSEVLGSIPGLGTNFRFSFR